MSRMKRKKKKASSRRNPKQQTVPPPDETYAEVSFLQELAEKRAPVRVRLKNNEDVEGFIEFFDANFIRLTRDSAPNLFIYKEQIKYICELHTGENEQKR